MIMTNRFEEIPTQPHHEGDGKREVVAKAEAKQHTEEKLRQLEEQIKQAEQISARYKEARVEYERITAKIEKVIKDMTEYREKVRVVWDEYIETEEGRERLNLGISNLNTFLKIHSTLVDHKELLDEKLDNLGEEFAGESKRLRLLFIELNGGIAEKN